MASNTWRGQNRAPDIFNAIPLNNVVVMNNFHGGSGGGFAGGSFEGGIHHVGIGIGGGANLAVNSVKSFNSVGWSGNMQNDFSKNGVFDNSTIDNYDVTGAVLTGIGTGLTAAEIKMYNQTTWFSLKQ